MRTKTLALSAVLGALGTTALVAQTNVYSLNAVGYINVALPAGFSIITCPLICSPTNNVATLFNNSVAAGGPYQYCTVYPYVNGVGFGTADSAGEYATPSGWQQNGLETLNPGQAVFFYNGSGGPLSATFVGTVPQGSLTNQLVTGFNLAGSIVPVSGDLKTNSIAGNFGPAGAQGFDTMYIFDTGPQGYESANQFLPASSTWQQGDPVVSNVYEGFFYFNANYNSQGTENWVENFSINP